MTNEMVCVVLIYSTIRVFYWCEDAIWSFPSWCNCRMKRIRTISEKVGILNLTSSMTYELILIGRVTNLTFGYKKSIEINKFFVFFKRTSQLVLLSYRFIRPYPIGSTKHLVNRWTSLEKSAVKGPIWSSKLEIQDKHENSFTLSLSYVYTLWLKINLVKRERATKIFNEKLTLVTWKTWLNQSFQDSQKEKEKKESILLTI